MQAIGSAEIGQIAPDFTLKGPGGQPVSLSDYRGRQNVVLVFYPFAFSPTCTHQLPEVQKASSEFAALDTVVFGVSVDSHHSNTAFAKQLGLTFPLLSDFGKDASTAYGVLNPQRGNSRRAIFVIDKQGRIAHKEVSASTNDLDQVPSNQAVLEVLRRLAA